MGRFENPCTQESDRFHSTSQLILKINHSLDFFDYPQSFHSLRCFSPGPLFPLTSHKTGSRKGKAANLVLRILFRSNASWQGTITWVEQNNTQRFRSVLELIHLIHSTESQESGFSRAFNDAISDYSNAAEG